MRCFIAIDIDEDIRGAIGDLQRKLQRQSGIAQPEVKWARPDLIHLTLKFLGEVKDRDIVEVCQIVKEAAWQQGPFSIDVKNLGTFGAPPRVIWVGIDENKELQSLHKGLDNRFAEAGFKAERRQFSAHLTLCRIKNASAGRKLGGIVAEYSDLALGSMAINSVCVYRSDLTKTGPVYTLISKSELR